LSGSAGTATATPPAVRATGRRSAWDRYGLPRGLPGPACSSPRRQNLTVYVSRALPEQDELLGRLGKHTTSKSCLYLRRLADVDVGVLRAIIANGFAEVNGRTIVSPAG
jgi:hypothetical protein